MKFVLALVIATVYLTGTANARKIRYQAQFFLQLDNATFDTLWATKEKLLVVDPDVVKLTAEENEKLNKQGKSVFAYLSIGQAETCRNYWKQNWTVGPNSLLVRPDPLYRNAFVVQYWTKEWQDTLLMYMFTNILPFKYSGLWLDYMQVYDQFTSERTDAAQEMMDLAVNVKTIARGVNPRMLIVAQDSISLYNIDERYKSLVDGVSVEEVWFHQNVRKAPTQTRTTLDTLAQIKKDKKVVFLEEYVEKNRQICEFYKKCNLEGFVCGAFDPALDTASRECVMQV